jgi:hypothetical protein
MSREMGYEDTSDEALLALARLGAGMNVDTRGEAERLSRSLELVLREYHLLAYLNCLGRE